MDSEQSSESESADVSSPVAYAPDGSLCDHCSKLTNRTFRGKTRTKGYGLTIGQLRDSQLRCRMCDFVFQALLAGEIDIEGNSERKSIFPLVDEHLASDRWPVVALAVEIEDAPGKAHYGPPTCGLRVAPAPDASKRVRKRFVCPPFGTEVGDQIWQIASKWLHGCVTHHRACRTTLSGDDMDDAGRKPRLPTRVIHIPSKGQPVLFESNGQRAQYLTLSYCWGNLSNIKLTKQNRTDFRTCLPMERIPQTIRDAIEATRRFEIEYLWVDSLCIIQDDNEDWEREAACMASIYSNALCTIAALGGETSESGLFTRSGPGPSVKIPWYKVKNKTRKYRGHFDIVQTLPLRVPTTSTRPVAGFRTVPKNDYPMTGLCQEMEASRWSTRGWVFQERTLSRRILYFGQYQIYWECQMAAHSEDGVDRLINDHVPHEKKRQFRQLRHTDNPHTGFITEMGMEKMDQYDSKGLSTPLRRGPPTSKDDKITDQLLQFAAKWGNSTIVRSTPSPLMWAMKSLRLGPGTFVAGALDQEILIRNYSTCQLTERHDKLPAFRGLGEAIAKRTGEQCVAGIWTGAFARGLFWYSRDPLQQAREPARAPSWSWASWDGPIIGFAEDNQEIKNSNDGTEMKDPEIWMQGGWLGLLKEKSFIDGNILMENEVRNEPRPRGFKPVSMKVTGFFVDVDQAARPCKNYNDLWIQLAGLLRTWPVGYSPWPQDQCRVLFLRLQDYKGKSSIKPPNTPYKCPKCHILQAARGESSLLGHVETCTGKPDSASSERHQDDQPDKIIGIARFDDPKSPPPSFRALILWNNSDRSVFHGADLYHTDSPSSTSNSAEDRKFSTNLSSMWGYREDEMHALCSCDDTILGLERCRGTPKTKHRLLPGLGLEVDIGGGWYAKAWPRRKRNYFLLLVEPVTEREGYYRRVGIGIAYWVPEIQRFGGVELPSVAKEETVVLL